MIGLPFKLTEVSDRELPSFKVYKPAGYAGYVVQFRYGRSPSEGYGKALDKDGLKPKATVPVSSLPPGKVPKFKARQVKLSLKDDLGIRITDKAEATKRAKKAVRDYVLEYKSKEAQREIAGRADVAALQLNANKHKLADWARNFIDKKYVKAANAKQPRTIEHVTRNLKYLTDCPKTPVYLEDLDKPTFEAIHDDVFQARGNPGRAHWANVLIYWYKFFKYLQDEGLMKGEKFWRDKEVPRVHRNEVSEEVIWTNLEVRDICAIAVQENHVDDCMFLQMVRYTSIYPSDIFGLKKCHFVETPDKKNKGKMVWRMNKVRQKSQSHNERYVQEIRNSTILAFLVPRLQAITDPNERIFEKELARYKDHGSFSTSMDPRVRRYWKIYCGRKKIPLVEKTVKALRHTFITDEVKKGTKLHELRQIVGHRQGSRILERVYLHLGQDID